MIQCKTDDLPSQTTCSMLFISPEWIIHSAAMDHNIEWMFHNRSIKVIAQARLIFKEGDVTIKCQMILKQ